MMDLSLEAGGGREMTQEGDMRRDREETGGRTIEQIVIDCF